MDDDNLDPPSHVNFYFYNFRISFSYLSVMSEKGFEESVLIHSEKSVQPTHGGTQFLKPIQKSVVKTRYRVCSMQQRSHEQHC